MESYYHRAGRRVPVCVSTCAFTVPRPLELIDPPSAWVALPLARRHALLVRRALVGRAEGPDRAAILRRIGIEARDPSTDRGSAPVDLPADDAAPVLVPPDDPLLLCPTGAVVAHFPEGGSAIAVARRLRPLGWVIDRPIRFLDRGFVLRRRGRSGLDPLTLANRLVEEDGCRFAHPVLLEEVVPALPARAPQARAEAGAADGPEERAAR